MLGIGKMKFAVNHITVPHLSWLELLNFARDIGASGVEFRNDLSTPLFSGEIPEKGATESRNHGEEQKGWQKAGGIREKGATESRTRIFFASGGACGGLRCQ